MLVQIAKGSEVYAWDYTVHGALSDEGLRKHWNALKWKLILLLGLTEPGSLLVGSHDAGSSNHPWLPPFPPAAPL
jgi:hypothetical protein